MIVWRLGGKIIWTVLCTTRHDTAYTTVVHNDTHTREQFLILHVCLGLDLIFMCMFMFTIYVFLS